MLLSKEAISVKSSTSTMKFFFGGGIQGHSVLILVDSGSSHSFVNAKLADVLQGRCALPSAVRYK
jgi:hypothetical protein